MAGVSVAAIFAGSLSQPVRPENRGGLLRFFREGDGPTLAVVRAGLRIGSPAATIAIGEQKRPRHHD